MKPLTHPQFWRHQDLPFVEIRQVLDGRNVCYSPHSHKEWSVGAIIEGKSDFLCEGRQHQVSRGDLVLMNPDAVHACNPQQGSPWAYYMMHLDSRWLTSLLHHAKLLPSNEWHPTQLDVLRDSRLYTEFVRLCQGFFAGKHGVEDMQYQLETYLVAIFSNLQEHLPNTSMPLARNRLYDVADYLDQHCFEDTPIEQISAQFSYSSGYLVRAFKRYFNLTPHAYRLNRRVQLGQAAIKQGETIADVAQALGFSDQAHFQRTFKQRVAATPHQYRQK